MIPDWSSVAGDIWVAQAIVTICAQDENGVSLYAVGIFLCPIVALISVRKAIVTPDISKRPRHTGRDVTVSAIRKCGFAVRLHHKLTHKNCHDIGSTFVPVPSIVTEGKAFVAIGSTSLCGAPSRS